MSAKPHREYTEAEVKAQAERLFPGQSADWLKDLVAFLLKVAPYLLAAFMARKPKASAGPGHVHHHELEAAATGFVKACELIPDPGKMGGPIREAAIVKAFEAVLDLAEKSVPAAAKAIDAAIGRFLPMVPDF